ncbi:MAG: 4Fe-4S dicluster domain-containing protein [ANME-2 cluster archaeon]|nr:4Fe-4S dicluster domain-containing protein [ANME-2 cluster archaeon]
MLKILEMTLKTGIQTTKYPQEPDIAPLDFRGKPDLFPDTCTFCGECAAVCPSNVIELREEKGEMVLTLSYCGCIFCGRCEEVCSQDAIKLTQEYEMASRTRDDLLSIIRRNV